MFSRVLTDARTARRALAAAAVGTGVVAAGLLAPPAAPANASAATRFQSQVVHLLNAQRRAHGCGNLTVSTDLYHSAQGHSSDMAAHNSLSHTGSDGSDPGARITAAGYSASTWAENIGGGYRTAAQTVNAWMRSPEHRANILNCGLHQAGSGYASRNRTTFHQYWTLDLGSPR